MKLAPERLFLLVATIAGLILVALITPMVGGNEVKNFQRAATIACGQVSVGPAALPGGIAELLDTIDRRFPEGSKPPYSLSRGEYQRLARLQLRADRPRTIPANPIAVLHPVSYLPQVPAIWVGMKLGLPPLVLFYLGRLAGLAAGIALTFFAIRIMPAHRHALAAVALLPPFLFSRSTLDADQFTNGLAFLFLATALRAIARVGRLKARTTGTLALGALLLAQAKSAYLLLPLQVLAIPRARFGSAKAKALACALICIPGMAASAAWMLWLRGGYFAGLKYHTWSGTVDPDGQMHLLLSNPFSYAQTLIRTVFGTAFIPQSIVGALGIFGPSVMLPLLAIFAIGLLLIAVIWSDQPMTEPALRSWPTRGLALAISAATFVIILTLLYLQWTQLGAPTIDGFSGRYLYPLAPLLLLFAPATGRRIFALSAPQWLVLLAIASSAATIGMTWATYLG